MNIVVHIRNEESFDPLIIRLCRSNIDLFRMYVESQRQILDIAESVAGVAVATGNVDHAPEIRSPFVAVENIRGVAAFMQKYAKESFPEFDIHIAVE